MAQRKRYSAILLLLALVTVPFVLVAVPVFQYRMGVQSDFQRMLNDIQLFQRGLAVAGPLERVRDLAPGTLRGGAPELARRFLSARRDTDQRLDAFIAALSSSGIPGLLDQAGALRREWRQMTLKTDLSGGDVSAPFGKVERVDQRLFSTLAAVLYMGDIPAGVRPRPNEVLSLPLNGLRQLAYDVGLLRSIAIYSKLGGGYMSAADGRALEGAHRRLREQIRVVDSQIQALAERTGDARLRQPWRALRASLKRYADWGDARLVAAPRVMVPWTQALEKGGAQLAAIHDFGDNIVAVAGTLVRRAHANSVRDTGWVLAGLALFYGLVLGLSLTFFYVSVRAIKGRAEVRAKSQFLARMSHEIRTPLNGVLGLAELLRETNPSPRQQEYIGLIENAGRTLNTLVNDVLDYAKLEAGKLRLDEGAFDPSALLIDCAHMFSLPASDNGDLVLVDVDPHLPAEVLGDAPRLRQVLTNLLSNAVKFTRHGWIRVSVRCTEAGDGNVRLELRVTDNGIGMTREEQRRLFQHFSQASASVARRFGGTGLGLSISQELVRLMGGEIQMRSAPGEGADFRFSIWLKVLSGPVPMPGRVTEPALVWDRVGNLADLLGMDARFSAVTVVSDMDALQAALEKGVPHLLVNGVNDGVLLDQALRSARQRGLGPRPVLLCGMREQGEMVMRDDLTLVRRSVLTVDEVQQLLSDSGPGQVPLLARREPEEGRGGLRVLIAEDNRVNQMVTRGYLERLGVVGPELCDDGQQALDTFAEGEGAYRLVLMDLDMPVMDGFTSARRMRELEQARHWSPAVILALSAHVMPEYAGRISDAGMDGQLIKPLTLSALQAALQTYLAAGTNWVRG